MNDDNLMDTADNTESINSTFNIDRFRLVHESDLQWYYRKLFIETFRHEYNEERLLCLAQCYANRKCFGCEYSEPLRSLLDQLSEKLPNSPPKRPMSQDTITNNTKRTSSVLNSTGPYDPTRTFCSGNSNFVSFSSSAHIQFQQSVESPTRAQQPKPDLSSMLYESTETKLFRLQAFADQLNRTTELAQSHADNDENDHAIEHIYQVGNQQRLFIDYRPDEFTNKRNSSASTLNSLLAQTFHGKLYIDEVYICSGQGKNKKLCKRNCFQKGLDRLLNEDFSIKLFTRNDGREQYELVTKLSKKDSNELNSEIAQDNESFPLPSKHPIANTKINFVHARDTTTIAGRIALEQSKLEKEYWQQWGFGIPYSFKPKSIRRSLSPPPPIPHQSINNTTPATIATVTAEIEQKAQANSNNDKNLIYPFPTKSTNSKTNKRSPTEQSMCVEIEKNTDTSILLSQKQAKLSKMQAFLFSLSNNLIDASRSIDIISTQINKYHLNADFQCPDKPTSNGFHGHLIIEQIEIADGFGITKKLSKKQTYTNALKSISPAKSFSLELCNDTRWILKCHEDQAGFLKVPEHRRSTALRSDVRPSRWGPQTELSAVTSSSTSAVRHFHERQVEESFQREKQYNITNGICIPPPALIEPPLTRMEVEKDLTKCTSSTDEAILNNIRRLIPNTFVIFELVDFDENIPGHYVSMLFTSMSKNKLELQYEFVHVPNGFMVTYTINNRFFMSWIGQTKIAAKQAAAKKAIEMLKTIYPSIKAKHTGELPVNGNDAVGNKCRIITRLQLYEQQPSVASATTVNPHFQQKEDMGSKLLKKMGWVGGGIGKDLQGIVEPIQIDDLQGRKGLGSNHFFPNQIFIKNLRRILEEFVVTNRDDNELVFSNEFNSEERRCIHKEAMKLHLTSNSYGRDEERRIRVMQKRNVDQLLDHLIINGGETTRYELKPQIQPKSASIKLPLHTNVQISPAFQQITAPDACDDETL